jgi:GAF domain-containing protein
LNDLCRSIDVEASPVISTVLLLDPDGERLWHTAAPVYRAIGSQLSARCSSARGLLRRRRAVERACHPADVATDINWIDEYRDLAIKNGIRAAWSEPILTKDGQVLGTFALYSSEPRIPTDAETELITITQSEVRLRKIIDTSRCVPLARRNTTCSARAVNNY